MKCGLGSGQPCDGWATSPLDGRLTSRAPHCPRDAGGSLDRIVVFPHADDGPTRLTERAVDSSVTFDVPGELALPVVGVRAWRCCVLRAAMPEAAVGEDADAPGREDDVGSHPDAVGVD